MSTVPQKYYSSEEYLEFERASENRHEYYRGEIFARSGASHEHSLIAGNLFAFLHQRAKSHGCEVHINDLRVKVSESGLYTYPDIVVVCNKAKLEDKHFDTLLNPSLIVEILSKSTESYDRGAKFGHYRRIQSLKEYVLVSQDQPRVEHYARTDDERWLLSEANGLDAELRLPMLEVAVPLREIFDRIEFANSEL